jgi:site-specific recombinase XerD
LAAAAKVVRDAVKDKSYRSTPLGLVAGRYLRWKRFEWGATPATIRDYEIPLSYLSIDYADLELTDFEPPIGTEKLREFLEHRWGERAARTRAKNLSILRDFFRWCVREQHMIGDPTVAIRSPKRRGVRRNVIQQSATDKIIAAAARDRDRVAVEILFYVGTRKSELTGLRLRDYDREACELTLTGKGGKVRTVPVRDAMLKLDIDSYIRARIEAGGDLDEYLLYPEKRGPSADPDGPQIKVIWLDRHRRLSSTAMHRWWKALLTRAGVEDCKLHEARHTAITEVVRDTGNLKLAQMLAGHASIQTTADIYAHLDIADLADALQIVAERRAERRQPDAK